MMKNLSCLLAALPLAVSAAPLPKPVPPSTPESVMATSPMTEAIFATSPFPGTTLVELRIMGAQRIRTYDTCFFLVRGTPEQVRAGRSKPDDVLQMTCTDRYVNTHESDVFFP